MKDDKQGAISLTRREAIDIGLAAVLSSAVAATGAGFAVATRCAGADVKPLNERLVTDFGAKPDDDGLQTAAIQAAIDAAADRGGGTIRFPKGRFLSGAIRLRDNIRLVFEEGAVLRGSANWRHFGQGGWLDALITAHDARGIGIEGPGRIDGANCENPKGEEGFRGPHAIVLLGCRDVAIADLAIAQAGNYAMFCRDCSDVQVRGVSVRGGHDALHAQACRRFTVRDCDFRTGDDCLAGCDNTDFQVLNCRINSSCNGFRFGCVNLVVRKCEFWGPGEHAHWHSVRRGSPRTNMLAAFYHFAPTDRNPKLPSDNWLVEDCTIDNVDRVYEYNFERGTWQTGQPARRLHFRNVKATRIACPLTVLGDAQRQFELTLEDVSIALRDDRRDQPVLDVRRFGSLVLRQAVLENSGKTPGLVAREGDAVWLDRVRWVPQREAPYLLEQVENLQTGRADDESSSVRGTFPKAQS
jgi:hypothetical protein